MLDELIERKAKEFCLDPLLVRAVIKVESNFNPWATRYEANFLKRYINPLTNEFILSRNPQMRVAGE
jgi:soluble lytic murein transglycosylase-like protein